MDLNKITDAIRLSLESEGPLDGSLVLRLEGIGPIRVEGSAVTNEDIPSDAVIAMSGEDFEAIAHDRLDPLTAVMTGRARIEGKLKVAGGFGKLLASARGRGLV